MFIPFLMKGHTWGPAPCKKCGKTHSNHPKGMLGKKLSKSHKEKITGCLSGRRYFTSRGRRRLPEGWLKSLRERWIGDKNPKAKWIKLTKEQVWQMFLDFKNSGLPIVDFCASTHISTGTLRKLFIKFFPMEYSQIVKEHLNTRGKRGREFEKQVAKLFEARGYFTFISEGSWGPADLICMRVGGTDIILAQCTLTRTPSIIRSKKEQLMELAKKLRVKAILATKKDGEIIEETI